MKVIKWEVQVYGSKGSNLPKSQDKAEERLERSFKELQSYSFTIMLPCLQLAPHSLLNHLMDWIPPYSYLDQ